MNSEDVIRFRSDVVITADLFNTLCGDLIGEGASRAVYEHNTNKDLVVKIAINAEGVRANCVEYEIWDEVKGLINNKAWVKDWIVPVEFISENGNILIMKRTHQKENKKKPTEVPKFLLDVHSRNFGWIGNKYMCHDYGFFYGFIKYDEKFKKIIWD